MDTNEFELIPVGERCMVEEIVPVDTDAVRASRVGLILVSLDEQKPRPTMGIVVAVGGGPLIQESVQVGDTVFFSQWAGTYTTPDPTGKDPKRYRTLGVEEITNVLRRKTHSSSPVAPSPQSSSPSSE